MAIADPTSVTGVEVGGRRGGRSLADWAGLWVPAIVLALLYLWPVLSGSLEAPAGFDTPKYIWRTELVATSGLDSLSTLPGGVEANPGRPAYPLVIGALASVLPGGAYELAFVVPAVFGALIGLAAGAVAMIALNEPRWAFAVYALSIGASVNVALTAVGHADNLLVSLLLLACAAEALRAGHGRGSLGAGVLLLVAALVTHWIFAALFLLVLTLLAASSFAWSSWSSWRSVVPPPARRGLVRLVLLSGAIGAVAVLSLVPGDARVPSLSRESFVDKLTIYALYYALPAVVPAAVLGAALLWRNGVGDRRGGVLLCLLWSSTAAVAGLGLALGAAVPLHRVLAFALGIPLLAIAAAVWLARRSAGRCAGGGGGAGWGRPAAAAILIVAVTTVVALGAAAWNDKATSFIDPAAYREARTADEYRGQLAPGRPAIFLLSLDRPRPAASAAADHLLRLAATPERMQDLAVYVGDAQALLAGRPTIRPGDKGFERDSLRYWSGVRPLLDEDPVILALSTMVDGFPPAPEGVNVRFAANGLAVLRGPAPAEPLPLAPAPPRPSALALLGLTAGAGLLLLGVGLGWSAALPFASQERVALAPALGLAAVVLVGLGADLFGVRPAAAGGIAILLASAFLGWLPKLLPTVRRGRLPGPLRRRSG